MKFDVDDILNLDIVLDAQVEDFNSIQEMVKELEFIEVETVGPYQPISFVSFDGGMLGIDFDPFYLNFIEIADSMSDEKLRFLIPENIEINSESIRFLDDIPVIRKFTQILGVNSILSVLSFPPNLSIIMDLTELACIFDYLIQNKKSPMLIMKDGLLRAKYLKQEYIPLLWNTLYENMNHKLIGVAKRSKVFDLLSTALLIENKIKARSTGYIKIPRKIEEKAYKWSSNAYTYAFGDIYLAKLSDRSNLMVTLEIPYDNYNKKEIYSQEEIKKIIGRLIRDSRYSYPTVGYPQAIMRAHEKAVQTGFTGTIWREKIINRLIERTENEQMKKILKETWYLKEDIKSPFLGGL